MPTPNENDSFQGEIVVASRIVDYLSSGLYESPAACLKELINNAYDADATEVYVFVKPDADRIIIEDNGTGMDKKDFVKHFRKISESHKRDESDKTTFGRPKIGKIGIGFIAANEICDVMEITSTKRGSTELLNVAIQFAKMREEPIKRRRKDAEFAKADYTGRVEETDSDSHFTHIFLKDIRGEARSLLVYSGNSEYSHGDLSLYGLSSKSVERELRDTTMSSWNEFDAYSKNRLEVALNVPVQYHENWIPDELRSHVVDFIENTRTLDFTVYFDGTDIRKPIVFNPSGRTIISRFEYEGKEISARGYFYAQNTTIKPNNLQGVLIRIRNAAVGQHDSTFAGFASLTGSLFHKWISGEIWADDRLEDAMNIDRRTLRVAHPAYAELQNAIHIHIDGFLSRIRREIYGEGSKERKIERAKVIEEKIVQSSQLVQDIAPAAAQVIRKTWANPNATKIKQGRILRKYPVNEFYEVVIEVAKETLEGEVLENFLTRLTERLNQ